MVEVGRALDYVVAAAFVLLGILGGRIWYRRRTKQSGWLSLNFGILGFISLLSFLMSEEATTGAAALTFKVAIGLLVLFPYFLFRFSTTLEPASRALEVFAASLTAVTIALPFFLPGDVPGYEDTLTPAWTAYVVLLLLQWTSLSLITAVRVWSGGRDLPEVARKRARLLSFAIVLLSFVIVVWGAALNPDPITYIALNLLTLVAALAFYFGFAPPRAVLAMWRRDSQDSLYGAIGDLIRAETEEEVASSLLPHITALLGARAVALVDGSGVVLDAHHVTEEMRAQIPEGPNGRYEGRGLITVPLRFGSLVVWINGYAPFFGEDEVEVVRTLGELAHAAFERTRAARIRAEERERLEAQISQAQKMEAIGHLAGGIAHDFNNLLSIIHNYTNFVIESLADGDDRRADLDEVRKAATRGAALTRQLLTFSRREIIKPEIVDVEQIVGGMENMLRRTLTESIDLNFESPGSIWRTHIDPRELEQVILNMAINARDAMDKGGTLAIALSNTLADDVMAQQNEGLEPGPYVCLRVSDTGYGIDKDVIERVFEPFFTTKERGAGTGLGLATVYGIVKRAKGYISVYSEPGLGATFRVYLPATDEEIVGVGTAEPTPAPEARGQRVLVVEDEEAIRRLIVRILSKHAYQVEEASCGDEALERLEQVDGEIDLLLTDVVMPGMSGKELAAEVRSTTPGCKVIFMSGYTDAIIAKHGILQEGENYLQKPFSAEQLMTEVARVSALPAEQPSSR